MKHKLKIGIITLPLENYNYGGILQAYAFQKHLEFLGSEVEHLDLNYEVSAFLKIKIWLYNFINYKKTKQILNKNKHLKQFIYKNLKLSRKFYKSSKLISYINKNEFDIIITGSDQVWRKDYALNIYRDLYLGFETNIKKFSYAASFGKDSLDKNENKSEIFSYLKMFESISVREKSGIYICEKLGIENTEQHVDPTMLLSKEDYISLINQKKSNLTNYESPYLLSYILDTNYEKENVIEKISRAQNLNTIKNGKSDVDLNNSFSYISIEEWLHRFLNASFIITDSFHGCVFSLIFNKPFIAIGNIERGLSRFTSLLELFDLKDRLILEIDYEKMINIISNPIDFTIVNKKILEEKNKSNFYFSNMFL